jgi:hypothetical protein
MRTGYFAAAGIAAAVLLAGCAGSGSSAGPSGTVPGITSTGGLSAGGLSLKASCDVVPASLVNAALGTDFGAATQESVGNAVACQYLGGKAGAGVIRIQTDATEATFTAERQGFDNTSQPTTTYPGLGDEAFSNVKHMPLGLPDVNTLVARHGSVEVLVTSSAGIAAEQTLVKQVFAKFTA